MAQHASAEPAGVQTQVALIAGHLRLDLAVPAHLPLLEVMPDLVGIARRAGATVDADVTLVEAGGQRLQPDATLAEQDVRDGALLMLRPPELPVPLTLHHDLVGAVEDVVNHGHAQVDAGVRRAASVGTALAGATLLAFVLTSGAVATTTSAAAALAVALTAAVGARRLPAERTPSVAVSLVLLLGYAPLAGMLWGSAWAVQAGGDPSVAGAAGAAAGASLSILVLSWAVPGRREWAIVPALVALSALTALGVSRLEIGDVSLTFVDALSAVVVLMVLAAAPLVSGLVQAIAVRGSAEEAAAIKVPQVADRVATAVRCVLALDVAVLVLALWVAPAWIARGDVGLGVWGVVVLLLWARTRGERLRVRYWVGLAGVGLLSVWGLVQWTLWTSPGDGASGSVGGAVVAVVLFLVLAGAWGQATLPSTWARRPVAVGERLLRLALPSLWLLSSGLLPGWPR